MELWVFWLIVVLILSFFEVVTVQLVSVWFIVSALVSLIISIFYDNFFVQFLVFVVLGVILLITTRPILNKWLKKGGTYKTNLDRVVGMKGIVTEDINKNSIGEVKVDGKRWSAISSDKLEKGTLVDILKIDGVKLVVSKRKDDE